MDAPPFDVGDELRVEAADDEPLRGADDELRAADEPFDTDGLAEEAVAGRDELPDVLTLLLLLATELRVLVTAGVVLVPAALHPDERVAVEGVPLLAAA